MALTKLTSVDKSVAKKLIANINAVKNKPTLGVAVAATNLVVGDAINVAERTTGNDGGAMWDAVLANTVTANGDNIVQCTGIPTLSLVRRDSWGSVGQFMGEGGKVYQIIAGALRQQPPSAVTITLTGSTGTVVKNSHGYLNGDLVLINGAAEVEYNGYFSISNVAENTFDYTVSGTPSTPATGSPTARKPSQWDWIKDTYHAPIGVDDSQPLIAVDTLPIPFKVTAGKIVSFVVAPDETFASSFGATMGASIGLSSATVTMSMDRSMVCELRYDGASNLNPLFITGNQQGGPDLTQVDISNITISGQGIVTVTHDYLKGLDLQITPKTNTAVVLDPVMPIQGSVGNTSFTFRVYDPVQASYAVTPDDKWRFSVVKTRRGAVSLGSREGSGNRSRLDLANILFSGIVEVA